MQILITGGSGFIGRHLAPVLAQYGHQVRVLDLVPPPAIVVAHPGIEFQQGSVLDLPAVDALVYGVDLVIHLAAIAEPMRYGSDPLGTLDVTLSGSLNVVRGCAAAGVPIVFASTSEIYGINPELPWSEDARRVLGPVSNVRWCYATAKATIEHYLDACRRQRGLRYTTLRLFNSYGPGQTGRVVDTLLRRALQGEPLQVHGPGTQSRCFCYVDDVVRAFASVVSEHTHTGRTYNVGSTQPTRIIDLARHLIDLVGSASTIEHTPYESLYEGFEDVDQRQPDTTRITRELGWQPRVTLSEGLALTVAAFRSEVRTHER